MANELLESYREASRYFNHVVFNEETRQFERAGRRHAIASFFGTADARAKNEATLKAVRDFMAIEREREYGVPGPVTGKDYFSGVTRSGRIEAAAIDRIIAKMRDDIAATPAAKTAATEKILQKFLDDEQNWWFLRPYFGDAAGAREMAETMVRFLAERVSESVYVVNNAGLESYRNEVARTLHAGMGSLAVLAGHSHPDAESLCGLFVKIRAIGAENGDGGKCLERFMSALFAVVRGGNGPLGDEVAVSGFLVAVEGVRDEDAEDLFSVVADVMGHGGCAGEPSAGIADCVRTVNGTLQLLRAQTGRHPDALKDGIRLMKDLHAPVGQETMKSLLDMAGKVSDALLDADRSFEESLDGSLASICFAGNGIASSVEKEEKNRIVSEFVLSSVPKVSVPDGTDRAGSAGFRQQTSGTRLLSSARSLAAFYGRAGGPLCAKYAKALEFLVDRYWMSNLFGRHAANDPNARDVPKALAEKYDMQNRTAAKPGRYRTEVSDYREFDGSATARAAEAAAAIDGIVGKPRIFAGDKVRAKHLAMQEIAFLARNGSFPDGEEVRRIANRYCRMAKWGGALLDRLEEVAVDKRKAVVLAMEAYGCSSDAKLFDMLAKDPEVLGRLALYVDQCERTDGQMGAPEGTSVSAWDIHTIVTGEIGMRQELDPAHNPHLATIYSRR